MKLMVALCMPQAGLMVPINDDNDPAPGHGRSQDL